MTEPVLQAVPDERPALEKAAPTPKKEPLQGGMPRRYADHRSRKAKEFRVIYEEVVEAYPPRHRLGRRIAALLVDLLQDYDALQRSKRKATRSARRKTLGLLYGALREVKNASSPNGASDDLAVELAKLTGVDA